MRVIQLVCLNLLPRGYVEAAYVLKIRNNILLCHSTMEFGGVDDLSYFDYVFGVVNGVYDLKILLYGHLR